MTMRDRRDTTPAGDTMTFPIHGTAYTVPSPPADVAINVMNLVEAARDVDETGNIDTSTLPDDAERDLYPRLLGDALDDLTANAVPWSDVQAVASTIIVWICSTRDRAEMHWNNGARPGETPPTPANRASRRASGASANTTRHRASGTPTKGSTPPATARRRGHKS